MIHPAPDAIASIVLQKYASFRFKPPPRQFTILAAFVLSDNAGNLKVISVGTGSKCLPGVRLENGGHALHDSHAEVLARRGAVRWLLAEIQRAREDTCAWLSERPNGKYALKHGVSVHLYVSTLPCGDASTRHLAALQDEVIAALKNSSTFPDLPSGQAARGRDNYSLYGVLRTKPGRADSPPTLSMSCSDKIASWNVLGIQGALASRYLAPIYIDTIVVGEVAPDMQQEIRRDCERAFYMRLLFINVAHSLPEGYALHQPTVHFTSLDFVHSRKSVPDETTSCNDSLCWVADIPKPEILINGLRRGISPKNRHNPKFRPLLSKASLLGMCHALGNSMIGGITLSTSYHEAKDSVRDYQDVKTLLRGPQGPFAGWVKSGDQYENFTLNEPDTPDS